MIDFVKLDITNNLDTVSRKEIPFFRSIDENTGECKTRRTGTYENLKLTIRKEKYLTLEGSLHKFYNNGDHNYNDYGFQEIVTTIHRLRDELGIDPLESIIQNIEFGVNINVPFNPTDFLKNQIINFRGQPRDRHSPNGKGLLIQFPRTSYLIKVYDKGAQYNQDDNILRFEIKTKRMAFVKSTGLRTLNDLLDHEKLKKLVPLLVKAFDEILIYDPADESTLSREDLSLYLHGINETFWSELKPVRSKKSWFTQMNPGYKSQRNRYDRTLLKFKTLLKQNELMQTKDLCRKLIIEKCNQLTMSNSYRNKLES